MDATQSHIKIHAITADEADDFAFDYDTESDDLLTELVPDLDDWGGVGWMELSDFEYDGRRRIINFSLETKWASPVEWLKSASLGTRYFENKLITMTTIQKDETLVTGVAVMDGEVLQCKPLLQFELSHVGRHYDDEQPEYDLDKFDNAIWDSIAKFVTVCEQFYLEGN
jgi:hypothetical protein